MALMITLAAIASTIVAWNSTIHTLPGFGSWLFAGVLWACVAHAAWRSCRALSRHNRGRCAAGLVYVAVAATIVTFGEALVIPLVRWLGGLPTPSLMAVVGALAGGLVLVGVRELVAGARDRPAVRDRSGLLDRIEAVDVEFKRN